MKSCDELVIDSWRWRNHSGSSRCLGIRRPRYQSSTSGKNYIEMFLNKPERVFGLQVRCKESDIFQNLGNFLVILEFFEILEFCGNSWFFLEYFRIFWGYFLTIFGDFLEFIWIFWEFWGEFSGISLGILWEYGRNYLFVTILVFVKILG